MASSAAETKAPAPIIGQTRIPIQLQQVFLASNRGEVVDEAPAQANVFRRWVSTSKKAKKKKAGISMATEDSSAGGAAAKPRRRGLFFGKNKTTHFHTKEPSTNLTSTRTNTTAREVEQPRKSPSRFATFPSPKQKVKACRWSSSDQFPGLLVPKAPTRRGSKTNAQHGMPALPLRDEVPTTNVAQETPQVVAVGDVAATAPKRPQRRPSNTGAQHVVVPDNDNGRATATAPVAKSSSAPPKMPVRRPVSSKPTADVDHDDSSTLLGSEDTKDYGLAQPPLLPVRQLSKPQVENTPEDLAANEVSSSSSSLSSLSSSSSSSPLPLTLPILGQQDAVEEIVANKANATAPRLPVRRRSKTGVDTTPEVRAE